MYRRGSELERTDPSLFSQDSEKWLRLQSGGTQNVQLEEPAIAIYRMTVAKTILDH